MAFSDELMFVEVWLKLAALVLAFVFLFFQQALVEPRLFFLFIFSSSIICPYCFINSLNHESSNFLASYQTMWCFVQEYREAEVNSSPSSFILSRSNTQKSDNSIHFNNNKFWYLENFPRRSLQKYEWSLVCLTKCPQMSWFS